MVSTTAWQWILGLVVVVIYGTSRFDGPNRLRSTTTFPRYFFAKTCYVGSVLFLFVLLAGALTDPAGIYLLLSGGGKLPEDIATGASNLPGPLLSALFMTSLLPTLPVLKTIDDWLKVQFQRLGNIPFEARQLSARLNRTTFQVPSGIDAAVKEEISAWDSPDIADALREDDLHSMLVRITALVIAIRQWGGERRYDAYIDEHKTELEEIEHLYANIKSILVDEWLPVLHGGNTVEPVTHAMRKRIRAEAVKLQIVLCDFISGGLLQCERLAHDRAARMELLGFAAVEVGRRPLRMDEIAGIALSIFAVMAVAAFVFDKFFPGPGLSKQFRIAIMVAIIYVVGIVVAIYPKSIFSEADIRTQGHRPYAAYLASAVIAATLSFFIALTFKYVFFFHLDFVASVHDSVTRWPWVVMTATATFVIAWVADNYIQAPESAPKGIRIYEAIGTAAAFLLIQWIVQNMLEGELSGTDLVRETEQLVRRMVTSGLVGAVLGYSIPHMCRLRYQHFKTRAKERRGGFQPT